jgi:LuxR family maltose regulon positive regulatory protein
MKLKFRPIVHIDDAIPRESILSSALGAPPTAARLTIIAAPAGFGKSTLLAQLAQQQKRQGVNVVWMNCDAQDRHPEVFTENVLTALAGMTSRKPEIDEGVPQIARQLSAIEQSTAVFLDEYEAASSVEVDALLDAIARTLPSHVWVFIASREIPALQITQLQLAGRLRIIDATLLRFSISDVERLLDGVLTQASVQQVAAQTEGWPFALQLFRMRASSGLLDEIPLDGLVKIPRRQIFDYLADEVLSRLDDEAKRFLIDVSVLELIEVAAANALRQRTDSGEQIFRLSVLKPIVVLDRYSATI